MKWQAMTLQQTEDDRLILRTESDINGLYEMELSASSNLDVAMLAREMVRRWNGYREPDGEDAA